MLTLFARKIAGAVLAICTLAGSLSAQTVDFSANEACLGSPTTLIGATVVQDSLVTSWLWDFDADGQFDDASGKTVQFTFGQPTAFPVRLKVTTTTGSDSMATPKDVIVHPLPDVNFRVDNLCEGETGLYQDQSSIGSGAITQYNWDFDNDGVVDDNSGPVVSFTNGPPATFVTRLTCVSDQGCSAFTEKTTEVFPLPQAAFSTGPVCVGVPTFFDNISLSDDPVLFYRWDFGDGEELIDSGDVNHAFDTVQDFEVTLIAVSDNNCRDTTSQTVTVNPLPDDSLELSGDSALVEGTTLTISVVGASNLFAWSTGSNASSITVSEAGNYAVTFTDANDCSASRSAQITVIPADAPVRIANNVLTPNGDGINDFLLIDRLDAYERCAINIYNRWNVEVFSANDYQNNWDGTDGGSELDAGAYYYVIQCTGASELVGNINILK